MSLKIADLNRFPGHDQEKENGGQQAKGMRSDFMSIVLWCTGVFLYNPAVCVFIDHSIGCNCVTA